MRFFVMEKMAGVVGFEPTDGGFRVPCHKLVLEIAEQTAYLSMYIHIIVESPQKSKSFYTFLDLTFNILRL